MTPNEFKAWFDGFTEAFEGSPTKKQWERIKARVAEIDGKAVTERVYLDRYWPSYPRYVGPYLGPHPQPWVTYTTGTTGVGIGTINGIGQSQCMANNQGSGSNFNSLQAMNALGRNDAQSLS